MVRLVPLPFLLQECVASASEGMLLEALAKAFIAEWRAALWRALVRRGNGRFMVEGKGLLDIVGKGARDLTPYERYPDTIEK